MDLITVAEFVVTLVIGGGSGYLFGHTHGKNGVTKSLLQCSCGHPHALHDPKTGRCNQEIRRKLYNRDNARAGDEYVKCSCMRYDGPPSAYLHDYDN